jgi:dienelactone hydrolase
MKVIKNNTIAGSKLKPISVDLFYNETKTSKPLVIFIHGFKGFKDWGHFNLMANTFSEAGFVFVKFNFSYNGTTPQNPTEFDDLEAFGNNNYTIELNDLEKIIDWVLNYQAINLEINKEKIYLIGHSRGGGIALLKGSEDKRIKKIVTWAAVSDFINRNKQSTINAWREMGVVHTLNGRTKQQMPLYYQFYENLMANKERLNIIKATSKLNIPLCIIHGTADEAVSYTDAKEIHKANKNSELYLVEGAGHTFDVKHPFEGETLPKNAQFVIDKTISFFKH